MTVVWKLLAIVLLLAALVTMGMLIDRNSEVRANRSEGEPLQNTIFAVGRIEGASPEIDLRPELAGRVVQVPVHEGDTVEAGTVLLQIEDEQYRQEVALAEAELALARAQLDRLNRGARQQERREAAALYQAKLAEWKRAEQTWKRTEGLLHSGVVPPQEADTQRGLVASLEGQVDAARARMELLDAPPRPDDVRIREIGIQAAQARLNLAQVQLDRTRLVAPRRGQVLKVQVEPGEMVGPAAAEPAIILADTSRFQVRAFVDELDAPRVQVGMKATITADGMPGKPLFGRVSRLSPRMSRKQLWGDQPTERFDTKTREVWISLEPGPPLVVGLRVDVTIDTDLSAETQPTGRQPEFSPIGTSE